jgi:hypothetical protein
LVAAALKVVVIWLSLSLSLSVCVFIPRIRYDHRAGPLDNDRRPAYVRHFRDLLDSTVASELYPTDMMIKLMDRGFAPVAIALSFVAGNGDRSGDELSIVEGFSDTARALSRAITIHALMTCARAPRPPPLRSCKDTATAHWLKPYRLMTLAKFNPTTTISAVPSAQLTRLEMPAKTAVPIYPF